MPLDIAVGILLGLLIPTAYGEAPTVVMVVIAMGFALLPDIDAVIEWVVRKGKLSGKTQTIHREWFHYPLTYVPVAVAIYLLAGSVIATLFVIAVMAHFIHDSIGIGWGIKWLSPFGNRSYKVLSKSHKTGRRTLIESWGPEELKQVISRYGDPNWMQNQYFKWSKTLLIEGCALIVAMGLLFIWLV